MRVLGATTFGKALVGFLGLGGGGGGGGFWWGLLDTFGGGVCHHGESPTLSI